MSYEIVYAREFIKTLDGRIIPMVLYGSNNCYEYTYGNHMRRERNWHPIYIGSNQNIAKTPEKLMELITEKTKDDRYEQFMRAGKFVYGSGVRKFFENGIRSAKTLKEISEECVFSPTLIGDYSLYYKEGRDDRIEKTYINTDEELLNFLAKADQFLSSKEADCTIYVCLRFEQNDPLKRNVKRRMAKERLKEFFAVRFGTDYVTKLTARGLYHSVYKLSAKQFSSQKEAERWINKNNLKQRFKGEYSVEFVS